MSLPIIEIDEIQVFPTFRETGLLASCSARISGLFQINNIKLFQGHRGFFLRYPSRINPQGTLSELAAPAHRLQRLQFRRRVLQAYKKALQRAEMDQIQLSLFPQAA
jgi:DNA-binding cell septation regulator SpoVG